MGSHSFEGVATGRLLVPSRSLQTPVFKQEQVELELSVRVQVGWEGGCDGRTWSVHAGKYVWNFERI